MFYVNGVGTLTADPVVRNVGENEVATLSLWWSQYDPKAENKKSNGFVRFDVWGNRAKAQETWLRKGDKVQVSGKLRFDPETGSPRIWTDKDGNPRTNFELTDVEITWISVSGGVAGDASADEADSELWD